MVADAAGQGFVVKVQPAAAHDRHDHRTPPAAVERLGEEVLLPGLALIRPLHIFDAHLFELLGGPLQRRPLIETETFEGVKIDPHADRRAVAGIPVLTAIVVGQQPRHSGISRIQPESTRLRLFGHVGTDAELLVSDQVAGIEDVAGHAGDRLNQSTLIVRRLHTDPDLRAPVRSYVAVFDQPLFKEFDLILPLRIGVGTPCDHRDVGLPLGTGVNRIKRRRHQNQQDA